MNATAHADRLARMCKLYSAGSRLTAELRASGMPLRTVAGMFASVANSRGTISTAGAESIRLQILEAQMRKGTSTCLTTKN